MMPYCLTGMFATTLRTPPTCVALNEDGSSFVYMNPYVPFVSELSAGTKIDEATNPSIASIPRFLSCISAHKLLPHGFMAQSLTVVSPELKANIECFEPNVHQFFPVQISSKRRLFEEKTYFIFNICNLQDSIDPVKSDINVRNIKGWRFADPPLGVGQARTLTANKSGFQIWREVLFRRDVYMSDALFLDCVQKKLITKNDRTMVLASIKVV